METDAALQLLGKMSKWQLRTYFVYAFGFGVPFSWMLLSVVFIGDAPAYRCNVPVNQSLNDTIPHNIVNGKLTYEQCVQYLNRTISNATVPCSDGYWYDPSAGYESTLVTDFNLVCESQWYVELSMAVNSFGSALGAVICSRLADIFGRKRVFLICLWSNIAIAFAQAFSPNFITYIVLSLFDGIQQQGMLGSSATLAMELFPTEQRTFAGIFIEFFWAFGYIALTPLAYFIRNWRHLLMAITVPLSTTIVFYWLVDESIPWLVANGRYDEAESILRKAARISGVILPSEKIFYAKDCDQLAGSAAAEQRTNPTDADQQKHEKQNNYSWLDIMTSPKLRLYTLVFTFIWFTNALSYYAISYTVTYLPGDRYLNFLLYGLMEVPAYIATYFLLYYKGRRLPIASFHLLAAVASFGLLLQLLDCCANLTVLTIVISLIGKFGITCSFAAIYVHTQEVYPTNVRITGMGINQLLARIGVNIGPFFRILQRTYSWMPPLIIGLLCTVAGLLTLILPETRHTPLPENLDDVLKLKSKKIVYSASKISSMNKEN